MKRLTILWAALLCVVLLHAATPKREFRATWLATVWNIDWPKTTITTTGNATQIAAQKSELTAILDKLAYANMNAIFMQVRPTSDALYNSAYEPWSKVLTGTRGKDPGYDPLAFAITEAHKRGLELHVWINPFRYETSAGAYGNVDLRLNHPEWILDYEGGTSIIDPGNVNAQQYIKSVIGDILSKYDIDGVVFDDYFYAYGGTDSSMDAYSQEHWKDAGTSLADWRRSNVNTVIKGVYDTIQSVKPYVTFGVAPFGIWTTSSTAASAYGVTLPSGITGMDAYGTIYCDPLAWLTAGTIDYISPQLYWTTDKVGQQYGTLCPWWSNLVKTFSDNNAAKDFHFYSSQSLSAMEEQAASPALRTAPATELAETYAALPGLSFMEQAKVTTATAWNQTEIGAQIDINRSSDRMGAPGSVFYNTTGFQKNGFTDYLKSNKFTQKALPPALDWKTAPALVAPANVALSGNTLSWTHAADNIRFAVYAYTKGSNAQTCMSSSAYLLGLTYEKTFDVSAYSSNYANTTFAVCPLDRYGNEHAAAFYNAGTVEPETPVAGNVQLTQLWSKSQAASGYLLTGNENRSMACYNGKLYIPNKTAGTFSVVDAATGNLQTTQTMTSGAFWMHNLRITQDGQMLLGNSGSGSNSLVVKLSNINTGGATDVSTLDVTGFGRTDYFFSYGSFNSAVGGFLLALSNVNGKVLKVPFANGNLASESIITHSDLPTGTSAIAVPADENSFYANTASAIPTLHSLTTGAKTAEFGSVAPVASGVSGMAVFTFKGRTFMVTTADQYGSVEVFEITNGLAAASKVCTATAALGTTANAAYTVAVCVDVQTEQVMLYVMAPNNGIAAYTFTIDTLTTIQNNMTEQPVTICTLPNGVRAEFTGSRQIELYYINGICIERCTAVDGYSCRLAAGVYLLRVGDKTYKIVK